MNQSQGNNNINSDPNTLMFYSSNGDYYVPMNQDTIPLEAMLPDSNATGGLFYITRLKNISQDEINRINNNGINGGYLVPGINGTNGQFVPGSNGMNGQFVPGSNGMNGQFIPGSNGTNGHWIPGSNGTNGYWIPGSNGTNGQFIPGSNGTNGQFIPGSNGTNGQFVPGSNGTNGQFVPGSNGTNGQFVPGSNGTNGYWIPGSNGQNGQFIPGSNGNNVSNVIPFAGWTINNDGRSTSILPNGPIMLSTVTDNNGTCSLRIQQLTMQNNNNTQQQQKYRNTSQIVNNNQAIGNYPTLNGTLQQIAYNKTPVVQNGSQMQMLSVRNN